MDGTRIAIGATGQTLRAGQPAIVFELIGKTSVRSPAGIDIDMVLSGYELVDVATLFRVAATYRIDMEFSGRQMIIVQRQSCTLE